MRRSLILALLLAVVVLVVLLVLATRAAAPSISSEEATQTAWAEILTRVYGPGGITAVPALPTPTPSPTLDQTALPRTAEAYATAHATQIGTLEMTTGPEGLHPRVTFSEDEINALLAPYVSEVPTVLSAVVDLTPGRAAITAEARALGLLNVTAHAIGLLEARHGRMHITIAEAAVGGIAPPPAVVEAVKNELAPLINRAVYDGLEEYAAPEEMSMTAIEIGEGTLSIAFIFAPPATVTPTVTPNG